MSCAVIVFAKAPVAGYAKTRLAPALGAEGAARLAERLIGHALAEACAAGLGAVELCCAPDAHHPSLAALAARHAVERSAQGDGDLGARMARALTRRLATSDRALLVGSDIPDLDAAYLRNAARALDRCDAVFGPALDGGYTLVGLRAPQPALFEGIAWGGASVMGETLARAAALGLAHRALEPLADIDTPDDLARLPPDWLRGTA